MKEQERKGTGFDRFRSAGRKPVNLSPEELIKTGFLDARGALPLLIQPAIKEVSPAVWAGNNREFIEAQLLAHGAILFRDFKIDTVERFEEFARAVSPQLLDYRERSSPRSEVSRGIYTSTDHPADQSIHFHNEQSYTHSWPMKLWFYCVKPAEQGGATPIADGRKVFQRLDPQITERFMRKRAMYVRNYVGGMGLSWETAFQTADKSAVENYCRTAGIDYQWKDDGQLRTRQIFDNIVRHPQTGELVWFEHVAFFHLSSLEPAVRDAIRAEFAEEDLPFNTFYGDGSEIEASVLDEIRAAYRAESTSFSWQENDLLLIDNVLTSHSREPYVGARKILVAMAELYSPQKG
ncbi:MAG TPA: TauD/TfdA family dioxygenase [Pyrinomonadaceae bacterium]|jgi:alpha-ketoglutarate-dependent taurine dioxygenase|nr:TauD/TfdA family dioxygenase [Pyrinomonadaceae bacterium]